jgi:hypothetical protein
MSYRYAAAVCVLAGMALVPTIIHSYVGMLIDDGRGTSRVPTTLAGLRSTASGRNNATWGKRRFDSDDWMERSYGSGGDRVLLTVIRSYDLKALYHHPELAVAYHEGHSFQPAATQRFMGHEAIPVHVLGAVAPDTTVAMYVLEYDGRHIENPIAFQLRTAGELLFSGRKEMTLFFAQGTVRANEALPSAAVTKVLLGAIDGFDVRASR